MVRVFLPLALTFLAIPNYVFSYCVINKLTDGTSINAVQTGGQSLAVPKSGRFSKNILSNMKECCPWKDYQCNRRFLNHPENEVYFTVSYAKDGKNGGTQKTSCPASGYIVARGTFENFQLESYDASHLRVQGQSGDD
ncbi:hypothetical protein BDC45DRAFT_537657 [Circinella umbellata]|nr:hypothetical protein BDC45DRAFT_537657 [Circinella umbellata]